MRCLGFCAWQASNSATDILAIDIFVGTVGLGFDRDRLAFDHGQRQVAHDHAHGGAADVKAAAEHAAGTDDDGVQVVHAGVSMDQMLRANFGGGVKVVAADGMSFFDHAVSDFAAIVDAEGADVDHPAQFSQPRRFENIDRAENIIGRAGVRVLLHPPADQTRGVNHGIDVEFFQRA